MFKRLICLILMSSMVLFLASCRASSNEENDTITESIAEDESSAIDLQIKEQEESSVVETLPVQDPFDTVFNYFLEKGTGAKSRHSLSTEGTYYVGISREDEQIQLVYMSDDRTQGVLLALSRDGSFNVLVNLKSDNEGVIGTVDMKASDYTYGYEFTDFTYRSDQTDWEYENFIVRANAYVRDTMLYADTILQDYMHLGLHDLGFTGWSNPGLLLSSYITAEEIAGMWDYHSSSANEYSNRLYLTGDTVYWRGYEDSYADAITAESMTEGTEFILSTDMIMSLYDPVTGEIVITDEYIGSTDVDREQFRRYIYRNADGDLCMRVESVYFGMSNSEDGKIYVKIPDEKTVSFSPSIYDPTNPEGPIISASPETTSEETVWDYTPPMPTGGDSYKAILEEYTSKMEKAVPGLVSEYETAASGIHDVEKLAEICNDKVGKLAEICNEGVGKMAELMYQNGDSYDTYDRWAQKLMDNYLSLADEITNAYLESEIYW